MVMMNKQALRTSLDSLINLGSNEFKIENVREYYVLYNNTLEYIKRNMQPDGELKKYYDKFPKINQYDLDAPYGIQSNHKNSENQIIFDS